MATIFDVLFSDESGQLVVANLHAANEEQVLTCELIRSFAEKYDPNRSPPKARAHAEDIVFGNPQTYQLAGPLVRAPSKNLVNVQVLSTVYRVLAQRYEPSRPLPPQDPEVMYEEVKNYVQRNPDDVFGREDRLLWIAERDNYIDQDVEYLLSYYHQNDEPCISMLEKLLYYFGLPIFAETYYLITEMSVTDWGTKLNENTYRRPTVFDGVDGDYFKQRRLASCDVADEWNKTINLHTADPLKAGAEDGAWEAVGKPLSMGRITRTAIARTSTRGKPFEQKRYVDCVKAIYALAGIDWNQLPLKLGEL